jgi:SAM-dependent methyltransferase
MCCPLCAHDQSRYVFSERGYPLRQCASCGLFFIDPYPDPHSQEQAVREYAYEDLQMMDPETHHRASVAFFDVLFPRIESWYSGAARVLDVGTGTGRLLELVQMHYPEMLCYGAEPNQARAEYARQVSKAEIHVDSLFELPDTPKYDVISLINVLSHIPLPYALDKLVSLMAEDGRLVILTGEIEDNVTRSDKFDWAIPDHLHFLGMRTLDIICRRWGLKVVMHERTSHADKIFSPQFFKTRGRSTMRYLLKRAALLMPFGIDIARSLFKLIKGERTYQSLIVLQKMRMS